MCQSDLVEVVIHYYKSCSFEYVQSMFLVLQKAFLKRYMYFFFYLSFMPFLLVIFATIVHVNNTCNYSKHFHRLQNSVCFSCACIFLIKYWMCFIGVFMGDIYRLLWRILQRILQNRYDKQGKVCTSKVCWWYGLVCSKYKPIDSSLADPLEIIDRTTEIYNTA